ncbi:hypothetical protein SODALDRAFT_329289 [Sodiomyces alkalinus F11]|uniref:Mid2 domain-containing protein n=1 Tax=Sodiomyces alkalinus (strain CBS 110278 / VKM F-3762 / F11) TaxID=1314773 RepID=A0A3N2PKS5_SODAK|nr:hypothetical protein SODALDRAFT_329289 [Sodiomyces alkalinus F11]ROT35115.1 hypothetical protein SODALDRAFT_329289 [Sodiomyces alkalinus F11]
MARLALPVTLLCLLHLCSARCYYPNGLRANGDFPCDPDDDDSPCCNGGAGWSCMSNKLCKGPDGNIIRGSCTDQNWESPSCPQYCLSANTGGTDLISCANVTEIDTLYCCDHTINCCNSGVGRFEVLPSEPEIWATWNRDETQYVVVLATPSSTSTSEEPSSTVDTESATTSTQSPTASDDRGDRSTSTSEASSPAETAPEESSQSAPQPSPDASSEEGLSVAAQAGIGAGAGVGAILIAAVIYLFWKLRKNQKMLEENQRAAAAGRWTGAAPYAEQPPQPMSDVMVNPWYSPHGHSGLKESHTQVRQYQRQELDTRTPQDYGERAELPGYVL